MAALTMENTLSPTLEMIRRKTISDVIGKVPLRKYIIYFVDADKMEINFSYEITFNVNHVITNMIYNSIFFILAGNLSLYVFKEMFLKKCFKEMLYRCLFV